MVLFWNVRSCAKRPGFLGIEGSAEEESEVPVDSI